MSVLGRLATIAPFLALSAAAATVTVSLDTSLLASGSTGPYYLEFQLVDGDGALNSTVTIGNFAFNGGAPAGVATLVGGASGDLSSSVTMTDASFFNSFYQAFTPSNLLTFDLDYTSPGNPPVPDRITFAILNGSLVELATGGAGNELLGIDLKDATIVELYSGVAAGDDPVVPAPTTTLGEVPEPSSAVMIVAGILAIGALRYARASRGQQPS